MKAISPKLTPETYSNPSVSHSESPDASLKVATERMSDDLSNCYSKLIKTNEKFTAPERDLLNRVAQELYKNEKNDIKNSDSDATELSDSEDFLKSLLAKHQGKTSENIGAGELENFSNALRDKLGENPAKWNEAFAEQQKVSGEGAAPAAGGLSLLGAAKLFAQSLLPWTQASAVYDPSRACAQAREVFQSASPTDIDSLILLVRDKLNDDEKSKTILAQSQPNGFEKLMTEASTRGPLFPIALSDSQLRLLTENTLGHDLSFEALKEKCPDLMLLLNAEFHRAAASAVPDITAIVENPVHHLRGMVSNLLPSALTHLSASLHPGLPAVIELFHILQNVKQHGLTQELENQVKKQAVGLLMMMDSKEGSSFQQQINGALDQMLKKAGYKSSQPVTLSGLLTSTLGNVIGIRKGADLHANTLVEKKRVTEFLQKYLDKTHLRNVDEGKVSADEMIYARDKVYTAIKQGIPTTPYSLTRQGDPISYLVKLSDKGLNSLAGAVTGMAVAGPVGSVVGGALGAIVGAEARPVPNVWVTKLSVSDEVKSESAEQFMDSLSAEYQKEISRFPEVRLLQPSRIGLETWGKTLNLEEALSVIEIERDEGYLKGWEMLLPAQWTPSLKETVKKYVGQEQPEQKPVFDANVSQIHQAIRDASSGIIRAQMSDDSNGISESVVNRLVIDARKSYAQQYLNDLKYIDENRSQKPIFQSMIIARDRAGLAEDLLPGEMLKEKKFIYELSKMLVKGEINDPLLQAGSLEKKMEPLFSRTPPMLSLVEEGLRQAHEIRVENQISRYYFPDGGAEVRLAAKSFDDNHISKMMEVYALHYSNMHEDTEEETLFNQHGILANYDFWYTEAGVAETVNDLSSVISDAQISGYVESAAKNNGVSALITQDKYVDSVERFNEGKSAIADYAKNFHFNTVLEDIVIDEVRKIPGLENARLNDSITIASAPGRLDVPRQDFTIKEIAIGAIYKHSSLFGNIRIDIKQDENGKDYTVDHPDAYFSGLKFLPGKVEERLKQTLEESISRPDAKNVVEKFNDIAIRNALLDYKKSATDSEKKEFGVAIDNFLAGKIQPKVLQIFDNKMSDIVALQGASDRYLAVSLLKQECRIVPEAAELESDKDVQGWLLSHLSHYDSQKNAVKNSFEPHLTDAMHAAYFYEYPVKYSGVDNYKSELAQRHFDKMTDDADSMIKTLMEKSGDALLRIGAELLSTAIIFTPASPLGIFCSAAMGTGATAMQIARYFIADTPDEKMDAVFGALMTGLFDTGIELAQAVKFFRHQLATTIKSALPKAGGNFKLPDVVISAKMGRDYRLTAPVGEGTAAKVYNVDNFMVKEYKRPLKEGTFSKEALSSAEAKTSSYSGALHEANNNAVAYNRLYGEGSSVVFIDDVAGAKTVSVTMPKVPGHSLSSILEDIDLPTIRSAKALLMDEKNMQFVVNDVLADLQKNGINHLDINAGNIMFDKSKNKFRLVDFDRANINPKVNDKIPELSAGQMKTMEHKLKSDLTEFRTNAVKVEALEKNALSLNIKADQPVAEVGGFKCLIKRSVDDVTCIPSPVSIEDLVSKEAAFTTFLESPDHKLFHELMNTKDKFISKIEHLDKLDYKVGNELYRAHAGTKDEILSRGLIRRHSVGEDIGGTDAVQKFDTYLKNVFIHAGGTGSRGKALSLSTEKKISKDFFKSEGNDNNVLVKLNPGNNKGLFLTAPQVVKKYAGYALDKKLITSNQLESVLTMLPLSKKEHEVFFMGKFPDSDWGELPVSAVQVIKSKN